MKISFRHRIAYRQARNAVLVAFILGTSLSIIQIGYELLVERHRVDATVGMVIGIIEESAIKAVYDIDIPLSENVIAGFFKYKSIRKARILDEKDIVLFEREIPAKQDLESRPGVFFQNLQYFSIFSTRTQFFKNVSNVRR